VCLWPVPHNVSDRGCFFLPSFFFFPGPVFVCVWKRRWKEKGNAFTCAFLPGSWIPGGLWLGRDLKIMGIRGDG